MERDHLRVHDRRGPRFPRWVPWHRAASRPLSVPVEPAERGWVEAGWRARFADRVILTAGPRSAFGSAVGCGVLLGVFEGEPSMGEASPCRGLDALGSGSTSLTCPQASVS